MSKRILALALFAVMVLSLVPMAQAEPSHPNVVSEIYVYNQTGSQLVGKTTLGGFTYPTAVSDGATVSGDVSREGNLSSDWNIMTINEAFKDLYKRTQLYSTSNVARFDVFVKIPIWGTVADAATDGPDGEAIVLPGISTPATLYATTTNYPLAVSTGDVDDQVKIAKKYLDFSKATVNISGNIQNLSPDFLKASYLGFDHDGEAGTGKVWAYYYLKIGEYDVKDVASSTGDFNLSYTAGSGNYNFKIRVAYNNSGESDKPIKPLYLKPFRKGDVGVYNVYTVNGVIFIDYAHDIANSNYSWNDGKTTKGYAAIPMDFEFYEDAAATVRVPKSGTIAYIKTGDSDTPVSNHNDKFFVELTGKNEAKNKEIDIGATGIDAFSPYALRYNDYATYANGGDYPNSARPQKLADVAVKSDSKVTMGVWLPGTYKTSTNNADNFFYIESSNATMKVGLYDEHYRYRTGDIKVVFRPLARNLITTAVIVERYLTIAVGEKATLTIESASATTYADIKLSEVVSTKSHVYISGMEITGLSVGTSQVQVSASGRVIDQITVNVVATTEVTTPAPAVAQWRVLARKLNIRSGPGTNYGKVGTLAMNQIVAGEDLGNGWVQIGANQFVSKQYVVPVSGSATGIGNYTVNASSLNVRSGPGSSYAKTGSLTRGTVVEIIAIQNGWAQLANGGWVSTLYLI